jgi:hypothetical protein
MRRSLLRAGSASVARLLRSALTLIVGGSSGEAFQRVAREVPARGRLGNEVDASPQRRDKRGERSNREACMTDRKPVVDLSKAHSYVIASNHNDDPNYAPYCMRCRGLHRMKVVEPFLWEHICGAIHDERQVLTKVAPATCQCTINRAIDRDENRCLRCGLPLASLRCECGATLKARDEPHMCNQERRCLRCSHPTSKHVGSTCPDDEEMDAARRESGPNT